MVAIVVEFFVGLPIALGFWTHPLVLLLTLYTLTTALIGHHFWTMEGCFPIRECRQIYKNVSIIGGRLLLYVTGAGKYSMGAEGRSAKPPLHCRWQHY